MLLDEDYTLKELECITVKIDTSKHNLGETHSEQCQKTPQMTEIDESVQVMFLRVCASRVG